MSLHYYLGKIKSFYAKKERNLLEVFLVISSSFLSFGLGILDQRYYEKAQILRTFFNMPQKTSENREGGIKVIPQNPILVASKNGKKYYFSWCLGVSRIKEENKVWFGSEKEAKERGYEPSKNCPGL